MHLHHYQPDLRIYYLKSPSLITVKTNHPKKKKSKNPQNLSKVNKKTPSNKKYRT